MSLCLARRPREGGARTPPQSEASPLLLLLLPSLMRRRRLHQVRPTSAPQWRRLAPRCRRRLASLPRRPKTRTSTHSAGLTTMRNRRQAAAPSATRPRWARRRLWAHLLPLGRARPQAPRVTRRRSSRLLRRRRSSRRHLRHLLHRREAGDARARRRSSSRSFLTVQRAHRASRRHSRRLLTPHDRHLHRLSSSSSSSSSNHNNNSSSSRGSHGPTRP